MVYKYDDYKFIKFVESQNKKYKYMAILQHKKNNNYVSVRFGGSKNTIPYRDTALKIYNGNYNKKNQERYKKANINKNLKDWTPAHFTWTRLYSLPVPK